MPCDSDPQPGPGAPIITSISPTSGSQGTTVSLFGENFIEFAEQLQVVFADFSVDCRFAPMSGELISDNQIDVVVPDNIIGSGFIYLQIDGNTISASPRFNFV
ncbi:MAG: IPT/TIG domain-containing protein, partial [Myxococcota bacterium]